jgi:dTDP-4-amino-4,6-dideoxygalactose transaminase
MPGQRPRIYLSPPHATGADRELLLEAFDSNWIAPLGPQVDAFEAEVAATVGVRHAAALSSGTAGLHLALVLLGVGPGDRVVTSSLTFASPANAVRYCGADPIFVDSEWESWNMNPELLVEALAQLARENGLPKAVIAVDLYGQCADYDRLHAACATYDIPLIEDAAEALGASYRGRMAGSLAAMGVLSFNGNKIITTGGGGMLLSDSKSWIDRARFLATQAREPVPHYQHETIGYNYRLSNLLAAVGRGQLQTLAPRVAARRATQRYYQQALCDLAGISFMPRPAGREWNGWLSCILVDESVLGCTREELRQALEAANIEARPLWKPMHLQPVFSASRCFGGAVAAALFERGLCLPSGSNLSDEDRERVVETIRRVVV